jgi:diguanylate cyclase (GGDEF)-like protein/PAS domain S-box-containing protein
VVIHDTVDACLSHPAERMPALSRLLGWRPGLRAGVLTACTVLIIGTAFAVSDSVSKGVARTATAEAVRSAESIIRGVVDPMLVDRPFSDPTHDWSDVDGQLERLVASGLLRIKVWDPSGSIVASDLPALRGRSFGIEDDLEEALDGELATGFSDGTAAENEFEHGLAARLLEMYLPIQDTDGTVVGVYEVYEDAAPILQAIDSSRQDVLIIVGALGLGLLVLLFGGFSGASRLLARQNRQLRRNEERFRSLLQNSADVNLIVDADGRVVYESPAVSRVLGVDPAAHVGRPFIAAVHPDDAEWVERALVDVLARPDAQLVREFRMRHADGSWRQMEVVLRNLTADPAVGGIVINHRDITTRKELEAELTERAFHDSLTGLANRALFADRLEHALARVRRGPDRLAVLFVDLDDFKTVNDSLGHAAGDALLVQVAARLSAAIRPSDTLARMGGDEFAVLIEDAGDEDAPLSITQRLLAALEGPFQLESKEVFVHASVGIALTTHRGATPDELLRNADVAMYTAKARGKGRVETFQPAMHTEALARLALKADLERALERHEFRLLYQPIMHLATGRIAGVEALIRWQHASRGLVAPDDFIAVAEETGLIIPIGRWVLEEACRQARTWQALGGPLTINVNVSAREIEEPGFVQGVADTLAATGLPPGSLTLELTESVLMKDADLAVATLAALKAMGVRLAIDDFGTGFSSFSYLQRFPVDELKIDRSFVAGLLGSPEQAAVVVSIVRLGESLRLETIAEGIEQGAQRDELVALGAHLGQGFLFAEPLEADVVGRMMGRTDPGTEERRVA